MRKSTSKLTFPNLIIKILPFILFSCVYYNTFYNAEVNYKKAKQIIEQTPQKDSENDKIPSQAKILLQLEMIVVRQLYIFSLIKCKLYMQN